MTKIFRLLVLAAVFGNLGACSKSASYIASTSNSIDAIQSISAPSEQPAQDAEQRQRPRKTARVVVRVLIDANGQQSQAKISESSGYLKIDKLALEKVSKWKFVPSNSAVNTMWHVVPLNFHFD